MRALWLTLVISCAAASAETVTVGSKNFTESYLLAEIAAQWLESNGLTVERRFGLGGSKICFDALREGGIDLYPEYSGTIATAILNQPDVDDLNGALRPLGLETLAPLGFNNSYVIAVRKRVAQQQQLTRLSDLADAADLNIALSHEFRARNDGWPALVAHYGLSLPSSGIEHGLAYQALAAGRIDATDAYSTDGELARYDLTLLADDQQFFPRYDALWLARLDLPAPVRAALETLQGRLTEERMQALNAQAALDQRPIAQIAQTFLQAQGLVQDAAPKRPRWIGALLANSWRHLQLAAGALLAAALVGISLALACQPHARAAAVLLYVCGLLQTVPSIALLALMIPLLGIGVLPALVALFLYALLPIVRATITALNAIEPVYLTVADALGMRASERRRYVLIPLAMPHIIAGLRTAAVISIGTATLAAFIGAGGLGQPIVTGLALNDSTLILQGAVPAALLAILTDLGFDWLERRLVPTHLRQR